MLVALGGAMILGSMVVPAMGQVPTIQPTTTTEQTTTTTTRPATTTTTRPATTTTPANTTSTTSSTSSTERPTNSSTAATTTSTAAAGATTTVAASSTTRQEGQVDPITNRPLVPTTTVPEGLDVGNPARISPIFPWLSVLGFLAAVGIVLTQYFLTGRRS